MLRINSYLIKPFRIALALMVTVSATAQQSLTIDEAVKRAVSNNGAVRTAQNHGDAQTALKKSSIDLPKTDISLLQGQYNSYSRNDNNITITQSIPFTAFGAQASYNKALAVAARLNTEVVSNDIVYQVKQAYYQLAYAFAYRDLLLQQDTLFAGFLRSASLRYETGESTLLEKTTAETQYNEIVNQKRQHAATIAKIESQLKLLCGIKPDITLSIQPLTILNSADVDSLSHTLNPSLRYHAQQVEVAKKEKRLEAARLAPDFFIGAFSQTLIGNPANESGKLATKNNRFTGFQVGVAIPLWFIPHQARIRSLEFKQKAAESSNQYFSMALQSQVQSAIGQIQASRASVEYYSSSALPNAALILRQAQTAFQNGEIGYSEYLLGLRNGIAIREGYLKAVHDLNQSIIYLEYLTGKQQ
jgi:cobalt-zinc-cadmium resistance protein CzcA